VRGYQEVQSPNLFNLKLWKTSGHYLNYKDNIFLMKIENHGFGMKPMNCPAHCLMFSQQLRTYKELPVRFGDFGVLHRNEISGALSGLTRVRRFCQDDAHIFCTQSQIMQEVMNTLDFLDHVYGIFGFQFELELSTRPEKRLGDESLWDTAEKALENALDNFGKPWKLNPGDGAFYGPKIDIKVYDALKRAHQCGTIQLDFQLPIRFNLQYKTSEYGQSEAGSVHSNASTHDSEHPLSTQLFKADEFDEEDFEWKEHELRHGYERPVIIHRAIMGSVERFMAILIEHLAGKWPFFLSPRQVMVVPISEKFKDYADSVYLYLHKQGWEVDVDHSNLTLNKKIRTHQLEQWNYILVVGEEEEKTGCVDIRSRNNERIGKKRVDEAHYFFQTLLPKHSSMYEKFYAKAWDPSKFSVGSCSGHQAISAQKEKVKAFIDTPINSSGLGLQIVAGISGVDLEMVYGADKKNSMNGRLPYLETADGSKISENMAIMKHIARMSPGSGLLGSNTFEQAQIESLVAWC